MSMSNVVKQWKGICVNLEGGNNKWWKIELHDNNDVVTHWGKIVSGAEDCGQSKNFAGAGESFYSKKIREKQNKSKPDERYTEAQVLNGSVGNVSASPKTASKNQILTLAKKQIVTSTPDVFDLIQTLADANVHNILSATGGQMKYDTSTGLFSTPLGIVNAEAITEARTLLDQIGLLVQNQDYNNSTFPALCNKYLRLIPRDLGRNTRLTPNQLFPGQSAVFAQNSVLDDLDASLQMVFSQPDSSTVVDPQIFDLEMNQIDDKNIISNITNKFYATLNRTHVSSGLKPNKIWSVNIGHSRKSYENDGKKLDNYFDHLYHGSRQGNILSILKNGFVIPPANSAHVTGRLFGAGHYLAIQSSKSLNYSYGYWDGKGYDNKCYLFIVEANLGKYYVPKYYQQNIPDGYNSFWAKPSVSGIQNDEIILPRTSMCNPTYLVEFIK
jgi:poly [ADP-ribose] polymerase